MFSQDKTSQNRGRILAYLGKKLPPFWWGRGQGRGQEDADLQDLELKEGREGTLQHGPGAILEGAIGSCQDPTSFG